MTEADWRDCTHDEIAASLERLLSALPTDPADTGQLANALDVWRKDLPRTSSDPHSMN